MLKSSVPVFLSFLTLIALPSDANPGQPVLDSPKASSASSTKTNYSISAVKEVSFATPGRQVRKFVDAYIKCNDESLSDIKNRSERPFTIIDSVLKVYDLPSELKYLAVIESELRTTALSHVGARGPWQLMAATARDLGLKVNGRSDERTSYSKSTKAAALYLRDLHRQFKDWLLVLAAYNAGPLPVLRAIHSAHSRNFWAISRYLPKETRQHVRRFIATAYYFNANQPAIDPITVQPGDYAFSGTVPRDMDNIFHQL
jgi:hypothetical protein